MSLLKTLVRRALVRCAYDLAKSEQNPPPTLESYLRDLRTREAVELSAICFDNELSIQSQLLNVFSESDVTFACPASSHGSGETGGVMPPPKHFVAVVDLDSLPVSQWEGTYPWPKSAQAILLCSHFGSCWTGRMDLARLAGELQGWSYSLRDVFGSKKLSPVQGPAKLLVLAFERFEIPRATLQSCRFQVLEALT